MNNNRLKSTNISPNEVCFGFNIRDILNALTVPNLPQEDLHRLRTIKRAEAEESIAFANVFAKRRYDATHTRMNFKKGDSVFITLSRGYFISEINSKLHQQRAGPFKIIAKVGPLSYRLDLPDNMRVHPVFTIAQLEPARVEDPYGRVFNKKPPPIEENKNRYYDAEVEAIVDKRVSRRKTQYLVK